MIERNPIFKETGENLKELGIEAIFYDLDDTLIFTGEIFDNCVGEYGKKISEETGLSEEMILNTITQIDKEEYITISVNPKRWSSVVIKMSEVFPDYKESIFRNADLLMKIYTTTPRMRPGASTILKTVSNFGVKQGLVTHANVEWTYRKLEVLGLWNYFDTIFIADENGHKGASDWKKAMDSIEVEPNKCLVIGDSLSGDIQPCDDLGARTMWISSPWSVYRTGIVPEKTIKLEQISEMLTALDRLR